MANQAKQDLADMDLPAVTPEALDWQFENSRTMAGRDERYALICGAIFLWLCTVSILANLSVAPSFHVNFFWIDFDVASGFWPRLVLFSASFIALGGYLMFSKLAEAQRASMRYFLEQGSPKVIAILGHAQWTKQNSPWIAKAFPVVGFLILVLIVSLYAASLLTLILSLFETKVATP